jgi:AAA domain
MTTQTTGPSLKDGAGAGDSGKTLSLSVDQGGDKYWRKRIIGLPRVSDEEYERRVAEMDAAEIRSRGRNGIKFIGRGQPDEQWSAVVQALVEHGAIHKADWGEAAKSLWVKNLACPECGSSSGYARRDKVRDFALNQIRVTCTSGSGCGTQGVPTRLARANTNPGPTTIAASDVPAGEKSDPLGRLRAALVDTSGLDKIPEPEPLIRSVLFRDSLAWLQGKPGSGKSFVALDMAGAVGTGLPWQCYAVTAGPVLYIAAEGVSGMRWRVRAWEEVNGHPMDGVSWLPMPVQVDSQEWDALIELAAELEPLLIVADTQARITVGMEENAAKDMGVLVHRLERLRTASRACVLVVHHQGRSGEHMRGSTALEGAATTVMQTVKDDELVTVRNPKQKDAEEFDDITLRLVPTGQSAVLAMTDGTSHAGAHSAALKMASKWWAVFRDEQVSASKLIASEVASERTFYRHVRQLIDEVIASKEPVGRNTYYRLIRNPDPQEEDRHDY